MYLHMLWYLFYLVLSRFDRILSFTSLSLNFNPRYIWGAFSAHPSIPVFITSLVLACRYYETYLSIPHVHAMVTPILGTRYWCSHPSLGWRTSAAGLLLLHLGSRVAYGAASWLLAHLGVPGNVQPGGFLLHME
jgi:hypothetical protein